jgi:hypothetical protein
VKVERVRWKLSRAEAAGTRWWRHSRAEIRVHPVIDPKPSPGDRRQVPGEPRHRERAHQAYGLPRRYPKRKNR